MVDFHVKYRGMVRELEGIVDGLAILDGGEPADPHELQHPSYHPTLGLTAARTAAADTGGVMVALRPPDALLHALAATGVVTEDFGILHVTLAYFDPPPDTATLHEVMRRWTAVVDPITLRLGGWGKFTPPGGEEVLYASIDSPGVERWRNALLAICRQEGLQWSEKHGFQPHLTVAYAPQVTVPDTPPPTSPVTIDTVVSTEGPSWTTWVVGQQEMGLAASRTAAEFYHYTDRADFALDPDYEPEDVYFDPGFHEPLGAGLFVTDVASRWEKWDGGREHVVTLRFAGDPDDFVIDDEQREWFIPADQFDHLEVVRVSSLHDGPEPALPRTDGDESDEEVSEEQDDMSLISQAAKAHLNRRQASMHAAKQALRDFTPMEQRELIDEGQGRLRARNLSALNLDGTHYDPEVLKDDPEDLGFGL